MYIKKDFGFYDLCDSCWSGAQDTLRTIRDYDKEEELMAHLEEMWMEKVPTLTELNDYLWFSADNVFEALGISEDEEEEEEEIDCSNQSCMNCYKYILGECEGLQQT